VLEGQPNFRDLGGLRTSDGSMVAGGQVFRSGELSGLTDGDLVRLEELGVRTVVDLRSQMESDARPDRLWAGAEYRPLRMLPGGSESTLEAIFRTGDFQAFPSWETIYRAAIRNHARTYASLIRLIARPDARPLVFHCTTGKDRTGIGAALLLSVLDVAWEDIEKDFLLSNDHLGPHKAAMVQRMTEEMKRSGLSIGEEVRPLLERMLLVEAGYLSAAREEMVALDGSVAGYLSGSLGIDEDLARDLRHRLLE